ncbi:restriction endonuclease subunit S [Vibrio coralliirubri]|uniref:restriction endonuclease subunit S n=1 Tax=Vibrio coralliirubri TaxID=1516159 RepID=UPI000A3BAF94|nr:restriction endonuclease subunit S [Vibrio coralliirubri]
MSAEQTSMNQLITDNIDVWTSTVKTKSASGRGSSKKRELYGVKKLRELILELAVRGKLVPQDSNDEPASVLLERIAEEQLQLVKEKKIKKPKKLTEITPEEKLFDLPEGWAWERLGNIGDTNIGLTYSPKDVGDTGTPVLRSANIQKNRIDLKDLIRVNTEVKNSAYVGRGDLLICARNGSKALVGKTAKIGELNEPMAFGAFMAIFRSQINSYVEVFLNSPVYRRNLEGVSTTTINQITQSNLRATLCAVPPFSEQHRIVAKVDELMTLCDQLEQQTETSIEAHQVLVTTLLDTLTNSADADELMQNWARISEHFDTLFTTEASIDQLKQTILQLAVMGKLVPQDPNDEPAAKLLESIAEEKAQSIKDKKIKKQKALPPITDDEKPFELPNGWEWCRVGDLSLNSESGWSPKCLDTPRETGKWGVLKVSAVTWGIYNPDENKELPSALEPREQIEVKAGDFLISRANTAELVAKAVIVPSDSPEKLMMSDKIIRFRFSETLEANYINLFNNSGFARDYYAEVAGGTSSSMKNVSRVQINNLVVALPPKEEQNKIVCKVAAFFTLCDQLKVQLKESQTTQLYLTDAIAEQAV